MIRYLEIKTTRREELIEIGAQVRDEVRASGLLEGVVHLWSMHTTCALTVNENADPDVARDLVWKMGKLVPHDEVSYRHREGNSDCPSQDEPVRPGAHPPHPSRGFDPGELAGNFPCRMGRSSDASRGRENFFLTTPGPGL